MNTEHLDRRPKVSVCVVTYNQEQYISQCLQSLVDQEVDFDFEVLVFDDCSTDSTRQIIERFCARYPEVIKPHFHPANIGAFENYLFAHGRATGRYIAHLDGDDCALPGKLQMQVDFLDAHPDCTIVWHAVDVLLPDGTLRASRLRSDRADVRIFTKADQINYLTIACHSSKMYRATVRDVKVPESGFIDFYINAIQLGSGDGAMIQTKPYGIYRADIGIASAGTKTRRIMLSNLEWFLANEQQYKKEIASAAIHLLLADIKNKFPTLRTSAKLLLRSFTLSGVLLYIRTYRIRSSLKF